MSHFTTIKTQLVDKECLKQALTDLNLTFEEGEVEIRGYNGQRTRVELRVPTSNAGYDIGFRRQGETYDLVADWWGIRDIRPEDFLPRLTQRYAYHAVKDQLEQQDFTILAEEVQENKTIHLTLRRMA